jgi:phospholipase/carboxylesterase
MAAELDGPRLAPRSGRARRLVVILHGYGADGNDLIEIGKVWQTLLPDAAFVAPHAPEPCEQAPTMRQWFSLSSRAADSPERWIGVN